MGDRDDERFAIATNEEWLARGVTAENWQPYRLDASNVPEPLRDLVPLVQRFGIGCDATRHDFAEKMSNADREELKEALAGRHGQIEDFLYVSPPTMKPSGAISTEQHAFQATLILEMEECDGPGIAGYLDYAIRKVKEDHYPSGEIARPTTFSDGSLLPIAREGSLVCTQPAHRCGPPIACRIF
jgi:hypothetical protein